LSLEVQIEYPLLLKITFTIQRTSTLRGQFVLLHPLVKIDMGKEEKREKLEKRKRIERKKRKEELGEKEKY
jgi:hypothetical protein